MPRKAIGDEPMTPAERAARSRKTKAEEHARLRTFVQWIINNHADGYLVVRARAVLAGEDIPPSPKASPRATPKPAAPPPAPPKAPAPKPRANAPQTLARAVVRPMFKGKPAK